MYQSDIDEVYKKFFTAVKKAVNEAETEYEADIYTKVAKIRGMVEMTEELVKEEE